MELKKELLADEKQLKLNQIKAEVEIIYINEIEEAYEINEHTSML